VWTKHYNQPPNLTLGGLHMTQIIPNFVEWANPTRNSSKWSCNGRQWWFTNFLPKTPLGMTKIFSFYFSIHSITYNLHYINNLPYLAYTLHISLHKNLTLIIMTNIISDRFLVIQPYMSCFVPSHILVTMDMITWLKVFMDRTKWLKIFFMDTI
jgi:hypothetical protein